MNIDYTGRHIEITPALREFAQSKLSKLEKLLDGPIEVHVVLAIEKHRHVAEIQVKSKAVVFTGTQSTDDLYASIGEVADKIERQALRHTQKMRDHKHRKSPRNPDVAAAIEINAEEGRETSGDVKMPAGDGTRRILRSSDYRVKPLATEDAALELESSGKEILVFRDAQTGRMCVLHRQKSGDLELIEPEF